MPEKFASQSTSTKEPTALAHGDIGPSFVEERGEGHGVAVRHVRPRLLSKPNEADGPDKEALRKARRERKTKLAIMGISRSIMKEADPAYRRAVEQAQAYRKARSRELCAVFGYVSSGVSSLLATEALATAGSRYLYERIAETNDASLLKPASQLADSARQNALAAWELCSRESIARKRIAATEQGLPWLHVDKGKNRPGRKTAHDETIDAIVDVEKE